MFTAVILEFRNENYLESPFSPGDQMPKRVVSHICDIRPKYKKVYMFAAIQYNHLAITSNDSSI